MKRYRTQPPLVAQRIRADGDGDFVWFEGLNGMDKTITVHEAEPKWLQLGILGPDGQPIEYLDAMEPIGFLWQFHEEEE